MYALEERSNKLRMLRSLMSCVCPLCGRAKIERTALCVPCVGKLPEPLAQELARTKFDAPEYSEILQRAFQASGAAAFIDPQPKQKCQRFSMAQENFTPARLQRSCLSTLCPACGAKKPAGRRLCGACNWLLEREYRAVHSELPGATEVDSDWAMYRMTMEPPACTIEPELCCTNFHQALMRLGAGVIYVTL